MKNLIVMIGIILLTAGIVCLIAAGLKIYGYYHILDGTPRLFGMLRRQAVILACAGLFLTAAGAATVRTGSGR